MPVIRNKKERLQVVLDATERIFSDDIFDSKSGRKAIMADMPDLKTYIQNKEFIRLNSTSVSAEMLPCWKEPLLSREQEQHISRQYNFLKFIARENAIKGQVYKSERFLAQSQVTREIFALANMRLAIKVIKKIKSIHKDDMLSEAYSSVFKATDYFDWRRGFKFSTYAVTVIQKNLWRVNSNLKNGLLKSESFQEFDHPVASDSIFSQEVQHDCNVNLIRRIVCFIVNEREREILKMRFGIDCQPMTLDECGKRFGVTKERIRQIQESAIKTLRKIVNQRSIALDVA